MKFFKNKIYFIFILFSLISVVFIKESGNFVYEDESETEEIDLEGAYSREIILNKDNNRKYIFHIKESNFLYFFDSSGINGYIHYEGNIECSTFCAVQYMPKYNLIYINYFKNATEQNITIKISSAKDFYDYASSAKITPDVRDKKLFYPDESLPSLSLFFYDSYTDFIYYFKQFDEESFVRYAEYNKEMNISDIINVSDKYFNNCNNKIVEVKPNTVYIFAILFKTYNQPFKIITQPKIENDIISISDDEFNTVYLSKEKESYILDFTNNTLDKMIQLSRITINSEISIEEVESNQNIILNKDNLYFLTNKKTDIFTGKLKVKVTKGDGAFLEFLSSFENDTEILTEKEYTNYTITNDSILIKFENNNKNKYINFNISSEDNQKFKFTMISGYAKGNYYHKYVSNQLDYIGGEYNYMEIKLYNENITLEEGEFFYLFLTFDKEKLSNETYKIMLNKKDKYSTDDINVYIPEENCKLVIDSFKKIFEDGYVYTEIKKNPPNPEYFGAADLIADLDNIKTKNRKYYDFYRDLRKIIGKMRDLHLSMAALYSPNGYDLSLMDFCLPFSFYIKGENSKDAKIYIKKFKCFDFYNDNEKEFIEEHLGKYITKINNTDPFAYIQNINREFTACYNNHSTFSLNLVTSHYYKIYSDPLTNEELSNIKFEFEDGKSITLDYYFYYENEHSKNTTTEFKNFLKKENSKNGKIFEKKSILELKEKFNSMNSMNNKLNENINDNEPIEWKYSTINGKIQCRVDDINNLNVFKQTSFHFLGDEYYNAIEVVENCTEEFYSNTYPIVGIESFNGGGICKLSFYFQELLQTKILPTPHYSVKLSELMKEYVEADIDVINTDPDMYQRIDIETCKPFSKF